MHIMAAAKKKKKQAKTTKNTAQKLDANTIKEQYLTLLKRTLLNLVYPEYGLQIHYLENCLGGDATYNPQVFYNMPSLTDGTYDEFVRARETGATFRRLFTTLCPFNDRFKTYG